MTVIISVKSLFIRDDSRREVTLHVLQNHVLQNVTLGINDINMDNETQLCLTKVQLTIAQYCLCSDNTHNASNISMLASVGASLLVYTSGCPNLAL